MYESGLVDLMPSGCEFECYHRLSEGFIDMYSFHAHNHYEFYLCISGRIHIAMEERLYTPEPYALFVYPPGKMHRFIALPDVGRYERIYAYVTRECLEHMSTPDFPILKMIDENMAAQNYSLQIDPKEGAYITAQLDEIIRHYGLTDPADRFMNRCRFQMMIASIVRQMSPDTAETRTAPSRIRDIIAYINDHLTEPLTLDELAEHFYVSKYYLLHAFKDYANLSVRQFIINKRLIRAQNLMREGTPPGEAARQSGFNDYAGFYRAFVKQTGITPQTFYKGGDRNDTSAT